MMLFKSFRKKSNEKKQKRRAGSMPNIIIPEPLQVKNNDLAKEEFSRRNIKVDRNINSCDNQASNESDNESRRYSMTDFFQRKKDLEKTQRELTRQEALKNLMKDDESWQKIKNTLRANNVHTNMAAREVINIFLADMNAPDDESSSNEEEKTMGDTKNEFVSMFFDATKSFGEQIFEGLADEEVVEPKKQRVIYQKYA